MLCLQTFLQTNGEIYTKYPPNQTQDFIQNFKLHVINEYLYDVIDNTKIVLT